MIHLLKYCYWYIASLIEYFGAIPQEEHDRIGRWQYYCWNAAKEKSMPHKHGVHKRRSKYIKVKH